MSLSRPLVKNVCFIAALVASCAANLAWADAPILATRGFTDEHTLNIQAAYGTRGFGVGTTIKSDERASWVFQLDGYLVDHAGVLRGARQWQLANNGAWGLTGMVGGNFWLMPQAGDAYPFDMGIGPVVGLGTGWNLKYFCFDIGLTAGAEAFFRGPVLRFPLRLQLGPSFHLGIFSIGAVGRAGADVAVGGWPAARYEVLAWAGLTAWP